MFMELAINKIRIEMERNRDNSYVQVVGQFLLEHIQLHPADAEKINNTEKTLAKSLNEMEKEARKRKGQGNCVLIAPQEGFGMVMKYFGITAGSPKVEAPAVLQRNNSTDFDVRLEDLL